MERIIIDACEKAASDHADEKLSKNDEDDLASKRPTDTVEKKRRSSITSPMDYGTQPTSHDFQFNKKKVRALSDAVNSEELKSLSRQQMSINSALTDMETDLEPIRPISHDLSSGDDHSRFPEFVVLDCSFVTGFDANASAGLFKLRNKLVNQELGSSVPLPVYLFFAGCL